MTASFEENRRPKLRTRLLQLLVLASVACSVLTLTELPAFAGAHTASGTPTDPADDEAPPAWLLALLKPDPDPARLALPCAKEPSNLATGEGYGLSGCVSFRKKLKAALDTRVGNVLAYLNEGKDLWFDNPSATPNTKDIRPSPFCLKHDAIPTPVCAPQAGGSTSTVDARCGARSPRPDGFCKYDDKSGIAFDTCGFEPALFSGLQNRILTNKTNEFKKSLAAGEITLVSFPNKQDGKKPVLPCSGYAEQLRKLLAGDDKNPGFISIAEALGYGLGVQGQCIENAMVPSNAQLVVSTPGFMRSLLKLGVKKPVGNEAGAYLAEHAACQLKIARTAIEFLFLDLATCEVMYRALPERMKYERFATITAALEEKVIEPCTNKAQAYAGSASGKWDVFYACYGKGPSSMFAFFDSLYQGLESNDPTPIAAEKTIPLQSIPGCSEQASDPAVAQVLNGTSAGGSLAAGN